MNLLEKFFGTLKTESDVNVSADTSLFAFALFIVVLVIMLFYARKQL